MLPDRVEDHYEDNDAGHGGRDQEADDIGCCRRGCRLAKGTELRIEMGDGKDGQHAGVNQCGPAFLGKALDGRNYGIELLALFQQNIIDGVIYENVHDCVDHSADCSGKEAHDAAVREVHAPGKEEQDVEYYREDL